MGPLEKALADVESYSCICRPTRTLLRVIEGLDMDATYSLIRKLQERVELASAYGSEAEDSPRWPILGPDELDVLVQALEECDEG